MHLQMCLSLCILVLIYVQFGKFFLCNVVRENYPRGRVNGAPPWCPCESVPSSCTVLVKQIKLRHQDVSNSMKMIVNVVHPCWWWAGIFQSVGTATTCPRYCLYIQKDLMYLVWLEAKREARIWRLRLTGLSVQIFLDLGFCFDQHQFWPRPPFVYQDSI